MASFEQSALTYTFNETYDELDELAQSTRWSRVILETDRKRTVCVS